MQAQLNILRVEPAQPSDAAQLSELGAITGAGANLQREGEKPESHIWVARERNRVVGYLLFWLVADELQIVDLATAPAHRRRGVATALLDGLKEFGHERGCSTILLEVRAKNSEGRALYDGFGFATARMRKRYYGDDDAVELVLAI